MQTVYITLDLRRGLWVHEATGALVISSYQSDLLKRLQDADADVWCFEEVFPEADLPGSSFLLLSRALTLNMLRERGKELRFVVFKPSNKLKNWAEKEGWQLIAADVKACRDLEDKITFAELAQQYEIPLPRHKEVLWNPDNLQQYRQEFGEKLIVQGRMGHAGSCTYVVDEDPFVVTEGTRVKISEFVEGDTYTLNGYVDQQGQMAFGPLWQQIMHVQDWNSFEMGTVGVSPVHELPQEAYTKLQVVLEQLSPLFQDLQYRGFFGIDLIWNGQQWYLIECNPRLTATVSLQCLVDVVHDREALLKLHAEQADLNAHRFDFLDQQQERFGQIILRNSKARTWKTPKTLKSGIYTHEAGEWKLRSRSVDARELEDGELLLLLSRQPGSAVESGSDFASIQFRGSAYSAPGQLSDHFRDFYERVVMGYLIRPQEMWTDRYTQLLESAFLLNKPVEVVKERHHQVEIGSGETLRLLGETEQHVLAERADGTRGWLSKQVQRQDALETDFVMPGKSSQTAEAFFKAWEGTPYCWGGNSSAGIDCSAFVQRYFWEVKGIALPKHSQDQKAAMAAEVDTQDLQNDDLVFLRSKDTDIAHVGVVYGGQLWHSSLEKGVVHQELEEVLDRYRLEGCRRFQSEAASNIDF